MTVLMPHATIRVEHVQWRPWEAQVGAAEGVVIDEMLHEWDYSSKVRFSTTALADLDAVLEETGIPDPGRLGLLLKVECRSSFYQGVVATPLTEMSMDGVVGASLDVPPGMLGDSILLTRGIVLLEDGPINRPDAPTRRGSKLLEQRMRVRIGGDGSRMSIEQEDFSDTPWPGSPWRIQLDYEDVAQDSYARATAVVVNVAHPSADAMLDPAHPQFGAVANMLKVDVMRAHLLRLASAGEPVPHAPDDDSVAAVLGQFSEVIFDMNLTETFALIKSAPEEFETRLKSHFEYLGGLK